LPSSLESGRLDTPFTFCSNNSRPVTYLGLPKDRCSELLDSLLHYIFKNFRACSSPVMFLARVDVNTDISENPEKKVFLFGARNLRQSLSHFVDSELKFEHHTVPGWMATQENITLLKKMVEDRASDCAAFVFDLFGNSSVRFEQYDGTTALPFRSDGIFHLGGKIVTTPLDIFKKIVVNVIPILKAKGAKPCVIIPPCQGTCSRAVVVTRVTAPMLMSRAL
jgi:hypothetical protein